ncbi:MAG: hypothetical protein R2724_28805 [Bryobacterales bacterium]
MEDALSFEIQDVPESGERGIVLDGTPLIVNGSLDTDKEEDSFVVNARAGQPLHFSVLAVQLGLPAIDPVLELFDADGKLLAEHDDLMTGQGTVIGNPDPSLYYTPEADGELRLVVRDRMDEAVGFRLPPEDRRRDARLPPTHRPRKPQCPAWRRGRNCSPSHS